MLLLIASNTSCHECPEEYQQTCISCDINNKCVNCRLGYFLDQGVCLPCMQGCIDCAAAGVCDVCTTGYALSNDTCIRCEPDCLTCLFEANHCTSCIPDYKLDNNSTCHYKYAMIMFLAALILVILIVTFTLVGIKKCVTTKKKSAPQKYESVLDDETMAKK